MSAQLILKQQPQAAMLCKYIDYPSSWCHTRAVTLKSMPFAGKAYCKVLQVMHASKVSAGPTQFGHHDIHVTAPVCTAADEVSV